MEDLIPIKYIEKDNNKKNCGITGEGYAALTSNEPLPLADVDFRLLSAYLIGRIPAENILNVDELQLYKSESQVTLIAGPLKAAKLVVVVKATRLCNLRCTYCHSWAEGPNQSVTFATMLRAVKRIMAIPNIRRFEFVWHGGEVTLLKPAFFKKLIWLVEKFRRADQHISHSMQSNAVNISDEWLAFIKGIGMNVGISLDGMPRINDARRVDYLGRGTAERVAHTLARLRQNDIHYGALIVVDREVYQSNIKEMFDYFLRIDLRNIEFLNIVPDNRVPAGGVIGSDYISYAHFISFLSMVFVIWWHDYRSLIRIVQFTDFIKKLQNDTTHLSACYWAGNCSQEVITLEPNGDVSPCDKYVGDTGSIYGSLLDNDLADLLASSCHNRVALEEERQAVDNMRACPWFTICQGGCPHDRVINSRHVPGYSADCCGTGKLLATIKGCLQSEGLM